MDPLRIAVSAILVLSWSPASAAENCDDTNSFEQRVLCLQRNDHELNQQRRDQGPTEGAVVNWCAAHRPPAPGYKTGVTLVPATASTGTKGTACIGTPWQPRAIYCSWGRDRTHTDRGGPYVCGPGIGACERCVDCREDDIVTTATSQTQHPRGDWTTCVTFENKNQWEWRYVGISVVSQ